MALLKAGDKVGIIALSNGLSLRQQDEMNHLQFILNQLSLTLVLPDKLYRSLSVYHATDKERAAMLMSYYQDKEIKAIFDVSGGDLANGILSYVDFDIIKANPKPFFGYSDLTTYLNALYTKTNQVSFLYQVRHLITTQHHQARVDFEESVFNEHSNLFNFDYEWIQGEQMKGYVIGGNIRCFLKLAGTPYMPSFDRNILFLESLSGDIAKISTYFNHLKQLGAFDQISGLVLGYFSELEDEGYTQTLLELIRTIIDKPTLPIIKTSQIGHMKDSKCLIIGKLTSFKSERLG